MESETPRSKVDGDADSALILTFAHDLRQPLRSIVVSAQRIQRNNLKELSPDTTARLEEILASARRQEELIASVVEYDQALHNGLAGDTPLPLRLVIQTACMKVDAFRQRHRGSIRTEPEIAPQMIAPSGLSRVLEKILHNSFKFHRHENDPAVEIRVSEAASGVIEIRISDTGLGIEPRYREMVFEPFKRLNASSEFPGHGLGLSISRKLLESIHGTVRFEDRGEGPGAMAVVNFPAFEIKN